MGTRATALGLPGPLPSSMMAVQALEGEGTPGGVHTSGRASRCLSREPGPTDTQGPGARDVTAWPGEGQNRDAPSGLCHKYSQ